MVARWACAMLTAAMLGAFVTSNEARFAILVFLILFNSPLLAKVSK